MNQDGNRMQDYLMSKESETKCSLEEYTPPESQAKPKKELKQKLRKAPKNVVWNKKRQRED